MAALLHPELANHSTSFNATFFQLNNISWINVTGDNEGRRRLQFGVPGDITGDAGNLATDGTDIVGD
eukprot:COSAG05_NODE_14301_length_401_cov_0.860927_1_plen_66_part_01